MGIGRIEFIRLTGLALTGTMIDPFQAVLTHDEYYINKKLGIMFTIPKSWGFIKIQDFGKLKEEQILDDYCDYIKDDIYEELGDPICIVTKYYENLPKHEGLFSPTIILNVNHETDLEGSSLLDFESVLNISKLATSNILKEFKVIKKYEPFEISGVSFYEFDATYLYEHKDLIDPIKVDLKIFKAKHNGYFYDFNCHQSIEKKQIAHNEFKAFKNSIKLI
ncbi:hypothetical protein DFQ10_101948 [Winogradskyella eximia]|uniref:Uncharacterized protein n=1 Tax=Winogradskyella eximia TaxID=262006 RepID=A0A3D9HCG8_9FLAO|nr:hypothetical protein [Winogradskyella eximia]RED47165.1 hypothetical protein DFQ10_101948 [Winogradskyella eximia]